MEDIQEQLANLRRRIARIDRKWTGDRPERPRLQPDLRPARYFVEELMSGEVVRTALGEHFETEKESVRGWRRILEGTTGALLRQSGTAG